MEDDPRFLNRFDAFAGKPSRYADFLPADESRLKDRLSEGYLSLLKRDGWASYRKQAIWTCDPDKMTNVKASWLGKFPNAEIFMRTAFGDFFFWNEKYCWTCSVNTSQILYSSQNVTWFFVDILSSPAFLKSLGLPKFSNRAAKKLGPLVADEVYFWNPAFALGGGYSTSTIEKGSMDVTLDILSQIRPIMVERV